MTPPHPSGPAADGPDGTAAHLDLDALADVLAGERPEDPHLSSCAPCASRLGELRDAEASVRAALTALAPPAPPPALDDRLQAALRTGTRPTEVRAPSVRRRPSAWQRAGQRSWQPAAAASLVLALVGGLGWAAVQTGGSSTGSSDTAASGGAESETAREPTTQGPAAGDLSATAAAPVLRDSGADYADPAQRTAAVARLRDATRTGETAGPRRREPSVQEDSATRSTPSEPPSPARPDGTAPPAAGFAVDPLARLRDPAALARCLSALGPGLPPTSVDYARYGAAPALAVLRPTADPRTQQLTVVGAGCSAGDPDVLLTTAVAAPG